MRATSARERRLIALLILTVLVAAIHFLIVAPIVAGFQARAARAEQLRLLYVHNVRTVATIPRLRRDAERARAAAQSFFLAVPGTEAGREVLKDRVQRAVEAAGGSIREGADAEGATGWARIRVSARTTLPQLTAVLANLQNQPPWLVIDHVGISAGNALVPGKPPILDVELEAAIPFRPTAAR
jgi:hypothetical protein